MKVIKAGILAGIIGIAVSIFYFFAMQLIVRAFPVSEMDFIVLVMGTLVYALPGALAGIFASRQILSTRGSLVPGLIAGTILAFVNQLISASLMLSVIGVHQGMEIFLASLPSFLILAPIRIAITCLCSALAVFFTRELYWSIPVVDCDRDPGGLKNLYDELWKDATTLIVDMNRSIRVYLFAGILMVICGLVILGMGLAGWQYISPRGAAASDYVVVIGEIAGGLIQIVIGPYLLYWYYKLKKRYSRLMLMEKTIGA